jgi:phosphate-selective porin OprO/OprP
VIKKKFSKFKIFFFIFICLILLESDLQAETVEGNKQPNLKLNLSEKLEDLGKIYQDKDNPFIQEAWLLGRFHGQYHWADGSSTPNDEGYETRRLRLGGQVKLLKSFTFHAQMVSGSDVNPFYDGFTELWGQWAFSPEVILTVGQQKHRFTHDRNVSSRYLNYLERGMLTNMFAADYTPAVTLQGLVGKTTYYTGFFSNATGRNMNDSFTELDSGSSFIAASYYDLSEFFSFDSFYLNGSIVHSNANENATNLNKYENGLSGALIITEGSTAFVAELITGLKSDQGNGTGINFQPSFFITDTIQLATRYQIAVSNDEKGLNAQRRYEKDSGLSMGDLYTATYVGINYYIAKHRLKLMSGIEYSTLGGEQVWTTSTMLRFYFGPHSGGAFPMNKMLIGQVNEYD